MSHLDRLRDGRYTSPSGKEFTFDFTELSRSASKKHAIHELPQQDLALVQDVGQTALRFPIKAHIFGPDYDVTADAFFAALGERGPGTLKHPRWGDRPVLAVSYAQSEQFVDGLREAIFDIDFVHAPSAASPESTEQTAAAIASSGLASRAKSAAAFTAGYKTPSLADLAKCKTLITSSLSAYKKKMLKVVGAASEVGQKLNAEINAVINDIDSIARSPLDLVAAVDAICYAPVAGAATAREKADAFADALVAMFTEPVATSAQAEIQTLIASVLFACAAEASVSGDMTSRAEAVAARDRIAELYAASRALAESAESSADFAADPASLAALASLSAAATAYLLEASYNLQVERRYTTEGEASPLELVYRFYGGIERLDEFIRQNHLQGDALFLIPTGSEVRYYDA